MRALFRYTCQPQLLMLHAANGLWKLYHFFFKFICLGQRPRRLLLFLSFIFAFVLIFACQPCAKVNSVSAHSTGKGQVGSPSPTWPAYTLEANFNLRSRKGEVGVCTYQLHSRAAECSELATSLPCSVPALAANGKEIESEISKL